MMLRNTLKNTTRSAYHSSTGPGYKHQYQYIFGKKTTKQPKKTKQPVQPTGNEEPVMDIADLLLGMKKGGDEHEEKEPNITNVGNHVYFYSDVNRKNNFTLNLVLKDLIQDNLSLSTLYNIEPPPIYLHINSNGGSVYDGLTTVDIIKNSRVEIHTIVEGNAVSAGSLMSVVGHKRYITPNAYMLIHQLSSSYWGSFSNMETEYNNLKDLMTHLKQIYLDHTKIKKKDLNEILKHDRFFNSELCIKLGLADELWTK